MRPIEFEDGPLAGHTGKIGRLVADTYDYVERNGTKVKVHRYRVRREGKEWRGTFVATLG